MLFKWKLLDSRMLWSNNFMINWILLLINDLNPNMKRTSYIIIINLISSNLWIKCNRNIWAKTSIVIRTKKKVCLILGIWRNWWKVHILLLITSRREYLIRTRWWNCRNKCPIWSVLLKKMKHWVIDMISYWNQCIW